jgi:hypothetical protein
MMGLIPQLTLVDVQRRQVERGALNYPVRLPAAYLSFSPIIWTSNGVQQYGETALIVDVYLDNHGDTFDDAERNDINAAEILAWSDKLYNTLQGYWCEGLQPLCRATEDTIFEDEYIHIQVAFNTLLIEGERKIETTTKPELKCETKLWKTDKWVTVPKQKPRP